MSDLSKLFGEFSQMLDDLSPMNQQQQHWNMPAPLNMYTSEAGCLPSYAYQDYLPNSSYAVEMSLINQDVCPPEYTYSPPTPSPSPELVAQHQKSPEMVPSMVPPGNYFLPQLFCTNFVPLPFVDYSIRQPVVAPVACVKRDVKKPKVPKVPKSPPVFDPAAGKPTECALCNKVVDWKNRSRHAMFHNKIFRFSCSLCDYQAHMKNNVKTHIRLKHDKFGVEGVVEENKCAELFTEIIRVYEACFPGKSKNVHKMRILQDSKVFNDNLDDSSSTSLDASANQSVLNETGHQRHVEIIGKRTCSDRLLRTLDKKEMMCCLKCNKMVSRVKGMYHAVTHASTRRFRCSECGVRNHCQHNLKNHISTQHKDNASVLDEITLELQLEYETLVKECFPELKSRKGKRMNVTVSDGISTGEPQAKLAKRRSNDSISSDSSQ